MRKFLAFVLALFIAIPLLIGAFVLISIQPWVVNRDFYKKALTDDKLYSGIQVVPKADPQATLDVGGFTFNTNSFQAGLAASLPKEEMKKFSGNAVDVVFDSLEGKPGGADTIDVEPLKASLRANSKKFVSAYVEALPAGESDKPAATDFSSLPKGITRVKYASVLNPLVSKALEDNFAKVDSKLSLESVRSTRKGMPFAKNLKTSYAISMLGNIAVAFALWMLAGMLWPKPWSSRLPFMGGVLLFSSLIIIMIGVGGALAVNFQSVTRTLQVFGMPTEWAGSSAQAQAFKGYFASLAATMTRGFFITGIIAASVGAGLISMRWVAAAREI
jgi:hypothetical protein